ncbi:MAG: hypothetical protein Q8R02_17490 [Hyphomonadaceae bacterium]|nr:hypothetical protein [Hyphomonadaceae bacterium]
MMRSVVLAAMACGLAACGSGGSGGSTAAGTSPAEEKLATQIVEVGGVIDITDQTIMEVAQGQVQMAAMQIPDFKPEQAEALASAIEKNIQAAVPDLKKQMATYLAEAFNEKELQTYYDFVGSKEGDTIKDRVTPVMQQSVAAADAMTSVAVQKAMEDLKLMPAAPPAEQLPPASTNAPPGVLKPTNPQ